MNTSLTINPKKFAKVLLTIIAVLFVGHSMYVFTQLVYGYQLREIFRIFDFNSEGNFPTMYSVSALVIASILLFFVGYIKRKDHNKFATHWLVLGGIFAFMAYDEAAKMHERLNVITRSMLPENTTDFLYFAWVIPYAILTLVVAFVYIRFLLDLPRRTAKLFVAAGAVFVTGAIGFEMLTGYYRGVSAKIFLIITIEESLEMLGIVLFIYAILDYIKNNIGDTINLNFSNVAGQEDAKASPPVFRVRNEPVDIMK